MCLGRGRRRVLGRRPLWRRRALHQNAGDLKVFWQGPSLGFDFGGEGARTMMLVYSLPATEAIYQRFVGIDGSAYFVGGLGMTAVTANNIVVVPIRTGVGLRLGANVGYLYHAGLDLEPVLSARSWRGAPSASTWCPPWPREFSEIVKAVGRRLIQSIYSAL